MILVGEEFWLVQGAGRKVMVKCEVVSVFFGISSTLLFVERGFARRRGYGCEFLIEVKCRDCGVLDIFTKGV